MQTRVPHIKHAIAQQMSVLRNRYHVKAIGIFGSVTRGEDTATSDIDLLVEFSAPISFFKYIELEEYLSRTLGRKVDLVTKNALKPAIRDVVLRDVVYV